MVPTQNKSVNRVILCAMDALLLCIQFLASLARKVNARSAVKGIRVFWGKLRKGLLQVVLIVWKGSVNRIVWSLRRNSVWSVMGSFSLLRVLKLATVRAIHISFKLQIWDIVIKRNFGSGGLKRKWNLLKLSAVSSVIKDAIVAKELQQEIVRLATSTFTHW